MSLHRVVCDCKCQDGALGNCGEYTDCETVLKLNYSFPQFTTKTEWGSTVGTSTATVSASSGNLEMFTNDTCLFNTCGYQGIKADECVEQQRCHTEAQFTEPNDSAVTCWHGDVYEDFKGEVLAEPQPMASPWNTCDCIEQATANGFYSQEIKEAYLRYTDRHGNEWWCQCSQHCGGGTIDDHLGGLCSDCYDGYRQVWYRGTISRMTFARLVYSGGTPAMTCNGIYRFDPTLNLDANRWHIAIGTQVRTAVVARGRNCQGDWGSFQYWVDCINSEGDCSNCRDNDRSRSWQCFGSNGSDFGTFNIPPITCGTVSHSSGCDPNTYSRFSTSSIWGLPIEIQDCKDLVGIGHSTSGVELVRRYCPASDGDYGTDARSIGDNILPCYSESGFEASSWSIGEA